MFFSDERNLWACALEVERQHGGDALLFAKSQIEDLQRDANEDGVKVWQAIRTRIKALKPHGVPCQ